MTDREENSIPSRLLRVGRIEGLFAVDALEHVPDAAQFPERDQHGGRHAVGDDRARRDPEGVTDFRIEPQRQLDVVDHERAADRAAQTRDDHHQHDVLMTEAREVFLGQRLLHGGGLFTGQAGEGPLVGVVSLFLSPAAQVDKLPDPEKPEGAVSKLPRFASLRSDDVNMRAGPGTRYRIDWVYRRRDLPVEIEREFDVWRWVRDPEGIQGWVHQATLMGRRSFVVEKAEATLRSDPNDTAPAVAILKPGVIGRIRSCAASSDWCDVQTGPYRGYVRRQAFWGLLPGEAINP